VAIKRYLVLVTALVGMGLGTVWWKTCAVQMGYRAVRLERELGRVDEEERIEDWKLIGLTSPTNVRKVAGGMGLSAEQREATKAAETGRRGDQARRPAVAARR
jgi:hypothetical protein